MCNHIIGKTIIILRKEKGKLEVDSLEISIALEKCIDYSLPLFHLSILYEMLYDLIVNFTIKSWHELINILHICVPVEKGSY